MTGIEIVIKYIGNKAFIADNSSLSFEQIGLPVINKIFNEPAYWVLKILKFFEAENRISVQILNYNLGERDFTAQQILEQNRLSKINTISFKSIDTMLMLQTMQGNKPKAFMPTMKTISENEIATIATIATLPTILKNQLVKHTISEVFLMPIKDVNFILGGVSFTKKFNQYHEPIEIIIANPNIKIEFDAIKNYFENKLKTKHIEVAVTIEIDDSTIVSIKAVSAIINKIDAKLIESVKFEFVKQSTKKKLHIDIDKSLFTMEEYFDKFGVENFNPNAFYNNDGDLFEDLLTISNTKHYNNLRFLSNLHEHKIVKLRFVQKPFSFIFLLKGVKNYHIVWETLDTEEATYIWHVNKNIDALKMAYAKIEDIINTIKVQGKIAYISGNTDDFRRLYHDYSNIKDGFLTWKAELESFIT